LLTSRFVNAYSGRVLSSARRLWGSLTIAVSALFVLVFAAPAGAATLSFAPIGGEQIFQVPVGVTTIHVVAIGAPGGAGAGTSTKPAGGKGAVVTGNLVVTPGQVLYVEVGGVGRSGEMAEAGEGAEEAFNGGGVAGTSSLNKGYAGGGGGASDLRTIPLGQGNSLASRLLVAAGGGGGGGLSGGGAGGTAGEGGSSGSGSGAGAAGQAGTAKAGGKGGGGSAADGSLGEGGNGGLFAGTAGGGGGGGGGLFGGGGGGEGSSTGSAGGGGGGGSSSGGLISVDTSGKPSITISYDPFVAPPPVVGGGGAGGGTGTTTTAPQTTLDGHPPKVVVTDKAKAKVKFRFSADVVRPGFLCKIDAKPFSACSSPKRYKLTPGSHQFKVKAVKGASVDPSPVVFAFRIKRAQ